MFFGGALNFLIDSELFESYDVIRLLYSEENKSRNIMKRSINYTSTYLNLAL